MKTKEEMLDLLLKQFPHCWFKPGHDFDGGSAAVWSGEGSYIEHLPAFDSYAYEWDPEEDVYVMGVHKKLNDICTAEGYYWESYDPGTYLLYEV